MAEPDIFGTILDALSDGVYTVDADMNIAVWNSGAESITGYRHDEVRGRRCADKILIHVDETGNAQCGIDCPLQKALSGEEVFREIYLRHREGYRVPVQVHAFPLKNGDGTVTGAVEVFKDESVRMALTEKIKELEVMAEKALYDPLTELFNRRYIKADIENRLNEMERYEWKFGILFIDIDHFKNVNDSHGHEVGDKVLNMVAKSLLKNARPFDIVGRWGGEEFIAVIVNVDEDHLAHIAERFRSLVEQSGFEREGEEVSATVSVGATMAVPGDTVEELIARADKLMYKSKAEGRNRVTVSFQREC